MTTPPRRRSNIGRLLAGAILVTLGILWLSEEFGAADIPWQAVLPAMLILVGAALMFGAATGPHTGLIVFGVVLTLLVLTSAAIEVLIDVPFRGGVGDSQVTPVTLEDEYRWAVGKMTVDLTDAADPGGSVELSVGIGELVVIVPGDLPVTVEATAGLGEVIVFGDARSGTSPEVNAADPGASLHIVARVGMGKVEVRRG